MVGRSIMVGHDCTFVRSVQNLATAVIIEPVFTVQTNQELGTILKCFFLSFALPVKRSEKHPYNRSVTMVNSVT
jgi:hypothetical protein